MSTAEIYHYVKVDDRIVTGGQPSEEQLKSAGAEGFQAVVNLAPHDSSSALPDEAAVVRSAGMAYHHLPVAWQNPQASDFEKFAQTLKQIEGQNVLIHCAANYRVTAFYSLYALQELNWSEEQADQFMAHFWRSGEYPIWDAFIRQMKARIKSRR